MNQKCFLISIILTLFLSTPLLKEASAQGSDQEVFLQFRHQGVVNTYVSAIYDQDQFYLSVSDLFTSLSIDLNVDTGSFTLTGNFLGKGNYTIDLNSRQARFLDRELNLTADDFIISDLGFYLTPDIFYELLDMEFIIDFSNLGVTLESPDVMPVVQQRERQQQRDRMLRTQREIRRDFYPLQYDRNQQVFNGGFVDYNLTGNYSQASNNFIYSTSIGSELLGGDLQGALFGSVSESATSLRSSGLRWRYGIRDNDWISTITAGQTTAMGLVPVGYTGVKFTNEPIEPRYMFGEIPFTGNVEPNSEVELYRNNTLIDFTEANESGQYRFTVPLTYGTSNYNIRVYSPTGEMSEREARLQIPFNFLPPGEITYDFDAGRIDNPIAGSLERGLMSKLNLNAGLTDRITALGGVEYFEDFHDALPTFRGGLSSRLFTNYLISLEAANDAFFRASGNVIYSSNASINIDYTNYLVQGGIYNPSRNRSSLRTNIFTPFEIGNFPLFLRWSFTNEQRETGSISRYRVDLNTRIARANIRLGYRDSQVGALSLRSTPVARINASATYSFSRSRELPGVFRGIFLRAQTNYIPAVSQFEDAEIQFSRNIASRGRFQFAAGRNFVGNFNLLRFSLSFDFNKVRSNTTIRTTRNSSNISQSIRGSVGYDSGNNNTILTNRQQVGRSGVAVRLFVDNNNDGELNEGDDLIPENAIRIDRAGGSRFSNNGIGYISQLQPYRQYNMTINKSSINNPLLVPELEQFSIITDPNQFKLIDIPFYMSGIVDGRINRVSNDGSKSGLGGLRLYLQQVNVPEGSQPFSEEIRTFSDGSFYAYEIPPGDYTIEVDPSQINFLNVVPDPAKIEFTLEALAEGDFVEGLEIDLFPSGYVPPSDTPEPVITASLENTNRFSFIKDEPAECRYSLQLGSFDTFTNAFEFAERFEIVVDENLDIIFNSRNNLYSVRTTETYNYQVIQSQIGRLNDMREQTVAVVNHCETETTESTDGNLHIQLGAFSVQQNAETLKQNSASQLGSQVFIHEDVDSGIFRVLVGPFSSQTQLMDTLQQLIFIHDVDDLFVRGEDGVLTEDVDYEYSLSLGEFANPDSAIAFVEDQEELIETPLDIVRIDSSNYQVVTEERTRDWDELIELSNAISRLAGLAAPVAQLFPAAAPVAVVPTLPTVDVDTEIQNQEETDAEITQVEPDSIGIPEITEIIEDEEFAENQPEEELIPVVPPVEIVPNLPVTTTKPEPDEIKSLVSCSFPIQVGSYGGHTLAQQMADQISETLDTEIHLYYNELSDMYALRTETYQSLQQSLEQLLAFKESEPFNDYAIVGQCEGESQYREHKPVQFLIPLIRYNHQSQANLYANTIKNNYGFDAIVRNAGEFYSVYAGPYTRYADGLRMVQEIKASDVKTIPRLIIDPETRNRFRAEFQIYLGAYFSDESLEITAEEFIRKTERTVTVKVDDQETKHLFDNTTYGSWLQFIEELKKVAEESGVEPMEVVIFD